MKAIKYGVFDFPTGFNIELLKIELLAAQGKPFGLNTTPDSVNLVLDDNDNEAAVRLVCTNHFAKTPQQRIDDLATANTDDFFLNGDKQKRFLLELFYQVDQRLRVLEAKPAITKLQFFNGVKNIYKNI